MASNDKATEILTIRVVSTKYDGSPRDSYDAQLLDHTGSMIRLKVPAGTPVYDGRTNKTVNADDNVIEIYFLDRWYNVWHMREHTVYPNLWYANVAKPAEFDGETLSWVDLDLDVRCYLDGSLAILDEDEFKQNRVAMSYPDDLVAEALEAQNEILMLGELGAFPFDHWAQLKHLDRGF